MKEKDLIGKIQLLKQIKPQKEWVIFCRANLAVRIRLERKQELLNSDIFALQGLFSFLRGIRPHYVFKALYAVSLALAIVLAGGGLTVWASMKSLPGSPLYEVKISLEKAYLSFVSVEEKNKLQGEMANRRLQELKIVLDSPGSAEDKRGRVEDVVGRIQQQLISDKEQLPQASQKNNSEKTIITVKEVANRAEQVKKAMAEAKESLSEEINGNLSEKLAAVTEEADKTSIQALEMIINKQDKNEAEEKDILARFQVIINEKETAINNLQTESKIAQATSTSDKLPINAVLINQADQATELLSKIGDSLKKGDFTVALETLKTLNEIVRGAERIVENVNISDEANKESVAGSQDNATSSSTAPSK